MYRVRYDQKAVFRYNTRDMKESERFAIMFERSIGNVYYEDVLMAA